MAPRNTWRLHPWLPVDVRLPALVGVATMGAYLWLEQNGKLGEAKQRFQDAKQASEGAIASVSSSFKSLKLPSWMQTSPSANKSSSQPAIEQPDTALPNDAPPTAQEESAKAEPASKEPEEAAKVVDLQSIDNLMQEALLGRESPKEETAPVDSTASSSGTPWATVQRLVSQLESETLNPQMLKMAEKNRSQVTVRDSTSEIDGPGSIADHVLHTSGVLGIKEDLSTSALLLHAKRIGMGTSSAVADVVRQQALVDSKELQSTLQQIAQHHSVSVVKAQLATEYWTQQAEQGQKIADEVNKGVASVLSEQRIAAQQDLHDTLKSKAQELTEKFGKEISDELKEQYNKLAQLGVSLKSLQTSLDSRKSEVAQCQLSFVLSGAAGSLHNALRQGCSTKEMVEVLDGIPGADGFVACVKKSLSSCGTEKVSSVKELQSRWPAVRRSVQIKANLHNQSQPGLLSTLLARMVSALKVSEWASVRVGSAGQTAHTLDVHLSAIDDAVTAGNLQDVATLLEEMWKYSHIGHVADDFTLAVKARVVAEQALNLVHAHAFALATLPETPAAASVVE